MADLTRRLARRAADVASFIGTCLVAILYGSAYGCVGYYIALAIDATGAPGWAVVTWLMGWVAVGSVVLTVWTIRWTGIGADWFKQDNSRTTSRQPTRMRRKERRHGMTYPQQPR